MCTSSTGTWTAELDERLEEFVLASDFNFASVSEQLGGQFSADECRLRFAALQTGDAAPAAAAPPPVPALEPPTVPRPTEGAVVLLDVALPQPGGIVLDLSAAAGLAMDELTEQAECADDSSELAEVLRVLDAAAASAAAAPRQPPVRLATPVQPPQAPPAAVRVVEAPRREALAETLRSAGRGSALGGGAGRGSALGGGAGASRSKRGAGRGAAYQRSSDGDSSDEDDCSWREQRRRIKNARTTADKTLPKGTGAVTATPAGGGVLGLERRRKVAAAEHLERGQDREPARERAEPGRRTPKLREVDEVTHAKKQMAEPCLRKMTEHGDGMLESARPTQLAEGKRVDQVGSQLNALTRTSEEGKARGHAVQATPAVRRPAGRTPIVSKACETAQTQAESLVLDLLKTRQVGEEHHASVTRANREPLRENKHRLDSPARTNEEEERRHQMKEVGPSTTLKQTGEEPKQKRENMERERERRRIIEASIRDTAKSRGAEALFDAGISFGVAPCALPPALLGKTSPNVSEGIHSEVCVVRIRIGAGHAENCLLSGIISHVLGGARTSKGFSMIGLQLTVLEPSENSASCVVSLVPPSLTGQSFEAPSNIERALLACFVPDRHASAAFSGVSHCSGGVAPAVDVDERDGISIGEKVMSALGEVSLASLARLSGLRGAEADSHFLDAKLRMRTHIVSATSTEGTKLHHPIHAFTRVPAFFPFSFCTGGDIASLPSNELRSPLDPEMTVALLPLARGGDAMDGGEALTLLRQQPGENVDHDPREVLGAALSRANDDCLITVVGVRVLYLDRDECKGSCFVFPGRLQGKSADCEAPPTQQWLSIREKRALAKQRLKQQLQQSHDPGDGINKQVSSPTKSCSSTEPEKAHRHHAVLALALRGTNAVAAWSRAIGPIDPTLARRTDPGSLRAQFGGLKRSRNLVCSPFSEC